MKKYILAAALSLLMIVLFAFPAKAATTCSPSIAGQVCAIVTGSHLEVTLLGAPVLNMTIPQTTIKVPVPGPTVRLPGVTVTAPPVRIPGQTVTVPAPAVTRTSTVTVTVGPAGQNGVRSVTIGPSTPTGQSTGVQPSAPTRVVHEKAPPPRTVTVTSTKAFVLSLGLLLLGVLIAFLIMILYYYLGWKGKERDERKFFNSLREDVQRITKG